MYVSCGRNVLRNLLEELTHYQVYLLSHIATGYLLSHMSDTWHLLMTAGCYPT